MSFLQPLSSSINFSLKESIHTFVAICIKQLDARRKGEEHGGEADNVRNELKGKDEVKGELKNKKWFNELRCVAVKGKTLI